MDHSPVTLEIIRRFIAAEGTLKPALPGYPPNYITVAPKRARELLEARVCRIPVPKTPAPEAATEKKPSGTPTAGPSTDSPSSSVPGAETPSFTLAADPASPGSRRRARRPRATATDGGSGSSQ